MNLSLLAVAGGMAAVMACLRWSVWSWREFSQGVLLLFSAAALVAIWRLVRAREADATHIQDLYNHAPCGYHSVDEDGTFTAINDTELSWLGYTRTELIGKVRHSDLMTPSSRERYFELFPRFKEEGSVRNLEFELVRRDGSVLPVLLNSTAIYDEHGRYISCRSTVYDDTERRHVLDELEAFSYTVSHDLRAPLRHIDGFSKMLERHLGAGIDDKSRHYLRTIEDSARQMGVLIDELLAFSRVGCAHLSVGRVPLDQLVADVRTSLASDAAGRRIEWKVAPLPAVQGDASLLRLVVANLLGNAVKYTRRREVAKIEIGVESDGAQEVAIFVRDNGAGFDTKHAHKLFGVFQRLHSATEFEGTGVGLANVRRIVERHGGHTWAAGAVDVGATFYFSLPKANASL